LPLHFEGTPFQVATWNALLKIPYGKTISYGEQAQMIQNPKAVRAVGRTNGLNPISIIVPCHRIVGKSGKLTGYASGLDDKRYLLELEQHIQTTYDKNINALVVKMPELITFKELEAWKDRFLLSLKNAKQYKNLALLLDTNRHQFESIVCLKLLRNILSENEIKSHISKVAMVQPEQYKEAKIYNASEAYFSSFEDAYDWLSKGV
jgi:O-6-methylguanine DNA methyltransferase